MTMRILRRLALPALLLGVIATLSAREPDYATLWAKATPFDVFLGSVKARQASWQTRFADAAIAADALTEVRALPGKRRILVVAEDRCSDSAWAVPYVAKLAAAVPERLELRVIGRRDGSGIQSANLTPDGRLATPTIVVLDENDRFLGAWVERPAELQKWAIANKATLA